MRVKSTCGAFGNAPQYGQGISWAQINFTGERGSSYSSDNGDTSVPVARCPLSVKVLTVNGKRLTVNGIPLCYSRSLRIPIFRTPV